MQKKIEKFYALIFIKLEKPQSDPISDPVRLQNLKTRFFESHLKEHRGKCFRITALVFKLLTKYLRKTPAFI